MFNNVGKSAPDLALMDQAINLGGRDNGFGSREVKDTPFKPKEVLLVSARAVSLSGFGRTRLQLAIPHSSMDFIWLFFEGEESWSATDIMRTGALPISIIMSCIWLFGSMDRKLASITAAIAKARRRKILRRLAKRLTVKVSIPAFPAQI